MPPKRTTPMPICRNCGRPVKRLEQTYCSRQCWVEYETRDPLARFWTKVEKTETCWLWRGKITPNGYGSFSYRNRWYPAHRFLMETLRGSLPHHLFVCHACDNPLCVRPDHLFLGTTEDNMRDMREKGRRPAKLNAEQVREILHLLEDTGLTLHQIAERFGVTKQTVWKIHRGKFWRHVTL